MQSFTIKIERFISVNNNQITVNRNNRDDDADITTQLKSLWRELTLLICYSTNTTTTSIGRS